MNVIETFIKLTSRTYPHGSESELFHMLPDYLDFDEFGNRYIQIGDNTTCMFTSHLDTATSQKVDVNHVIEGKICKTDGTSILGADDKAGVTIMLWMIYNKVPGLYYFFLGEEVGCVGSKALASKLKINKIESINKVISFDRRGTGSVITYQASTRCCSDNFANALAKELNKNKSFNYSIDPSGIWTDSAQFTKIYQECTNISVGYKNEHSSFESQDLEHLEQLADTCLHIDWESLPIERDPSVVDSKYSSYYDYDYDYDYAYDYGNYNRYSKLDKNKYSNSYIAHSYDNRRYFWDELSNFVSSVSFARGTGKLSDIELGEERMEMEKNLIAEFMDDIEVEYASFTWDGLILEVIHSDFQVVKCTREELSEFVKELNFWKHIVEEKKNKSDRVF